MSENSNAPEVVYKDVPGFPGYRVGDDGSVWSCRTFHNTLSTEWHRLIPEVLPSGRLRVRLCRNGKPHKRFIHRLILETFIGACPPGHECAHDNGVKTDNRLVNLAWKTPEQNAADRDRHGTTARGEKNGFSKLTASQVLEIRASRGKITQQMLGQKFGISRKHVQRIQYREVWAHFDEKAPDGEPSGASG